MPNKAYSGSIEEVLAAGEYDQGDFALVDYDELFDLVEQAKAFVEIMREMLGGAEVSEHIVHKCNRPLHPCLGGKSPYSEFLPL